VSHATDRRKSPEKNKVNTKNKNKKIKTPIYSLMKYPKVVRDHFHINDKVRRKETHHVLFREPYN
jgi:hypothetical protein